MSRPSSTISRVQPRRPRDWLKPANVFSRPVGDDRWHGNLGMDVLAQAKTVTIDFRSMSVGLK